MPNVDKIMRWEDGDMDDVEEREFFEELVSSGDIFHLQGMYGRRARDLGLLGPSGNVGRRIVLPATLS